ncbi:MAG: hypothetical protein MUP16_09790 [Sedimentisphaerales bacterium]|nr:hypothetical protein [Sedimentisphaerales bacterium]
MKRIVQYIIPALLVLVTCYGGICWAISITAPGSWSQTIDASNLVIPFGAGSNLNDTYQSDPAAVSITITATNGNWKVQVKKNNSTLPGSLHLYIQRTSDGSGLGSISGGNPPYQEVEDTDQDFFSGNGDRSNVSIQLELTGVSIQVPQGTYSATIQYTVSDQ